MRMLILAVGAVGGLMSSGSADAMDRACAVTEVAPGVKMRSGVCSNLFETHPQRRAEPTSAIPYMSGQPTGMRFGDTEIRVGGSARFEMQQRSKP
ncbi:hypothetical protein [Alsobacter sp. SYSU BS001988]|jgi:hypothetical protein